MVDWGFYRFLVLLLSFACCVLRLRVLVCGGVGWFVFVLFGWVCFCCFLGFFYMVFGCLICGFLCFFVVCLLLGFPCVPIIILRGRVWSLLGVLSNLGVFGFVCLV